MREGEGGRGARNNGKMQYSFHGSAQQTSASPASTGAGAEGEVSLGGEVGLTLVKPLSGEREREGEGEEETSSFYADTLFINKDKARNKTSKEGEAPGEKVRRVFEEERRVLVERARLLAEGVIRENYTAYLGLKVRPTIKKLWDSAPLEVKRAAKQALEATVLAYYLGGRAFVGPQQPSGQPVVVNLNMNIVNARAEARAEANADLGPLLKLLGQLIEELEMIKNLARHERSINAKVIERKAKTLLERVEAERARLRKIAFN